MSNEQFLQHKQALIETIISAIKQSFDEMNVPFDREALIAESGAHIEDLAAEALFYGAEVFPM